MGWEKGLCVGNRKIGESRPTFIIAEAGSNHDGSYEKACKLMRMAKWAGADAIKFQSFRAETLVNARELPEAFEKLKQYELPSEWIKGLAREARGIGIIFLSTPFDETAVDGLQAVKMAAFKVASGDLTYHELVRKVAGFGKPIFLSTGMATIPEIHRTLQVIRREGNAKVVVMHCVSNYPATLAEQNLRAITLLRERFNCLVGFSDHTLGDITPLGAVALGACVLEKHFTLRRRSAGLDHPHSTEPEELRLLVDKIRSMELALGKKSKGPQKSEIPRLFRARRGLYARYDIPKETILEKGMAIALRPQKGLCASLMEKISRKEAAVAIPALSAITSRAIN